MRVVVTGATGNVGTSLLRVLARDPKVAEVVGVARRMPAITLPKVRWAAADVARDALVSLFEGADAVVHLAWLIQPSRREDVTRATNVEGSSRVFEALVRAKVPALIYASSVGAYSPGPKDHAVDETWPTGGIETSFYSRHKAEVERRLDQFEQDHGDIRVVRLRPGLIFKGDAATGIRRLFAGPFLPAALLRRRLIPAVPRMADLRFQAVHSDDVAEAYRLAVHAADARGAYNVAAEPVLDDAAIAAALRARTLPVSPAVLRGATGLTWRLRLQPTPPGWLDMALSVPVMDTSRMRRELGWSEAKTGDEAFRELIEGLGRKVGYPTPPLDPRSSGPLRVRELASGLGARSL